jgi:predicted nucleic acid-binding protein
VIVSNASPLIVLLKINKLSILKELFEKIVVPETVYKEITAKEHDKLIFDKLEWIKVRSARNIEMTALLEKLIDRGEAEAIVLARELSAILLIDDAKARKYAKLLNIEVIGTLGLLKIAKRRGLVRSVRKVINDMLAEGYYIEDKLVRRILKDIGES